MKMINYDVICETFKNEDYGEYKTYGIVASDGVSSIKISDISTSSENANNLAKLLNRNNVSLEHFYDIVNDFIAIYV